MIRVERGAEPDGFGEDADRWRQEFQVKKTTERMTATQFWSLVRKRKAMKLYAQQLYRACYHKCVFCEL
jgi:hypothetical protein